MNFKNVSLKGYWAFLFTPLMGRLNILFQLGGALNLNDIMYFNITVFLNC